MVRNLLCLVQNQMLWRVSSGKEIALVYSIIGIVKVLLHLKFKLMILCMEYNQKNLIQSTDR